MAVIGQHLTNNCVIWSKAVVWQKFAPINKWRMAVTWWICARNVTNKLQCTAATQSCLCFSSLTNLKCTHIIKFTIQHIFILNNFKNPHASISKCELVRLCVTQGWQTVKSTLKEGQTHYKLHMYFDSGAKGWRARRTASSVNSYTGQHGHWIEVVSALWCARLECQLVLILYKMTGKNHTAFNRKATHCTTQEQKSIDTWIDTFQTALLDLHFNAQVS